MIVSQTEAKATCSRPHLTHTGVFVVGPIPTPDAAHADQAVGEEQAYRRGYGHALAMLRRDLEARPTTFAELDELLHAVREWRADLSRRRDRRVTLPPRLRSLRGSEGASHE